MYGSELCAISFWWIVPIAMMILCFLMMRRRWNTMVKNFGFCGCNWRRANSTQSARDLLDRRYASGDIDEAEYEARKRTLAGPLT